MDIMKRALYNLGNEEFAFLVDRIGKLLKERQISHIVVGGTAVQAHILDRLTKKHRVDIEKLTTNDVIRFQDYIRLTDDIDVAMQFLDDGQNDIEAARKINDFCDELVGTYISGTDNHIFEYTLERRGVKRPVLGIIVDNVKGEDLLLNISRKSSDLKRLESRFYNHFVDHGVEMGLPYSNGYVVNLRVPKLEHVLATKIASFRAKDAMDIQNLVGVLDSPKEIDTNEIERILLPVHEHNYFERFRPLLD